MDTYFPVTLYLRQQGCEDLWLFCEAKRFPRAGKFGKHWCVELAYQRSTENAPGSLCFTRIYKKQFQNSNPRTRPIFLMLCPNEVRLSYEPFSVTELVLRGPPDRIVLTHEEGNIVDLRNFVF